MPTKTIIGYPATTHANISNGTSVAMNNCSASPGALDSTLYGITGTPYIVCGRMQMHSRYGRFTVYDTAGNLLGQTVGFANNSNGITDFGSTTRENVRLNFASWTEANLLAATNFKLNVGTTNSSYNGSKVNFRKESDGVTVAEVTIYIDYYVKNTAPSAPTIVYPAAANKTTYNTKPWFRFKSGSDAESTSLTTYWRVDSGTWQSYSGAEATNTDKQWTTALSTGSHTVYAYSSDGSLTSSTVSRAFTIASPISTVSAGSKIDDATIDSLQTQINNLRAYYGLAATTFTTVNAGTKALDDHIDELETAFEATPHKTNVASVNAGDKIATTNVNNLRTGLLNG